MQLRVNKLNVGIFTHAPGTKISHMFLSPTGRGKLLISPRQSLFSGLFLVQLKGVRRNYRNLELFHNLSQYFF